MVSEKNTPKSLSSSVSLWTFPNFLFLSGAFSLKIGNDLRERILIILLLHVDIILQFSAILQNADLDWMSRILHVDMIFPRLPLLLCGHP